MMISWLIYRLAKEQTKMFSWLYHILALLCRQRNAAVMFLYFFENFTQPLMVKKFGLRDATGSLLCLTDIQTYNRMRI